MHAPLRHPGAAFLDRDGTINVKPTDGGYVETPDELRLLPRAGEAIARLNTAGLKVFVVTNQRGIALGRLSEATLKAIHNRLSDLIGTEAGAHVDEFFYCPHQVGSCSCRKPGVGMFLNAANRWPQISLGASAMVGDSLIDVEAGMALGMTTIRLGLDVPDLSAAVDALLTTVEPPLTSY